MPRNPLPIGLSLIAVGLSLVIPGAISVWLGTNGVVINNVSTHFGPTAAAEISNGWILISASAVLFVASAVLLIAKRSLIGRKTPHIP